MRLYLPEKRFQKSKTIRTMLPITLAWMERVLDFQGYRELRYTAP
jgi:hypothetical protein